MLLLAGACEPEVAQHSYKGFKESREEFLRRLLDPALTLEEAARVLNVCPTTVRRYTNRGILKHFRTAGNQRRFRLSHVFAFMEEHMEMMGNPGGED
jgi:excisionase family DNA binding protein